MTVPPAARVAEQAQALRKPLEEVVRNHGWYIREQEAHSMLAALDGLLSVVATLQQERDEAQEDLRTSSTAGSVRKETAAPVWGSVPEHDVIDALGSLVEQLQHAVEAHHAGDVQAGRECPVCATWSAGMAQRFEQVDAALKRLAAPGVPDGSPETE